MGDPRLRARHLPAAIGLLLGAGADGGEVGTGVRLGEDGGREARTIGNARQEMRLLLGRAVVGDQLARDFRARTEAACTDPPAREFFRDHRHRQLAEAEAAVFFRDAHPEHAKLRHFGNHRIGDQRIIKVPLVGKGRDLLGGKGTEALAHQIERFVPQRLVGTRPVRQQRGKGGAGDSGAALGQKPCDRRIGGQHARLGLAGEGSGAHHFAGAHGQAIGQLAERLAQPDPQGQFFRLTEAPAAGGPRRPVGGRLDCGEGRGGPGIAMHRVLFALHQRRIGRACRSHPLRQLHPHRLAIFARCGDGRARILDPFAHGRRASRAGRAKRTRKNTTPPRRA